MARKISMIKNALRRKSRRASDSSGGVQSSPNNSSHADNNSSGIGSTSESGGDAIVDSVRTVGSSLRSGGETPTKENGKKAQANNNNSISNNNNVNVVTDNKDKDDNNNLVGESYDVIHIPTKTGPSQGSPSPPKLVRPPQQKPLPPPPRQTSRLTSLPNLDSSLATDSSTNTPTNEAAAMQLEGPKVDTAYELVPHLEMIELPRGGVSVETQAVGYVQFGIPPETIKDSMKLGIAVPSVYIVPVDRFCRDFGPALGVNLAEFEFPAYFNFFVQRKRCTLIVDSVDAERNIRRVFSETLLGPAQFRRENNPLRYEKEDFAPDFPREAIPDFQKELQHFRIMPNGEELVLETLLKFCHFESAPDSTFRDNLGAPPLPLPEQPNNGHDNNNIKDGNNMKVNGGSDDIITTTSGVGGGGLSNSCNNKKKSPKSLTYSQIRWIGDVARIYPSDAPEDQIAQNKTKRVEIFKMPSGTDYVLHDIDENNIIVGKARFSGNVRVSEGISVIGLDDETNKQQVVPTPAVASEEGDRLMDGSISSPQSNLMTTTMPPTFSPPSFGVTVLGNSHGFDKSGSTSGYVLWVNGRGVMIDPPPYSSATLEREGIRPRTIVGIILTHCHADHDAGAFQKVLTGSPVVVITTPTIYKSFIRKYAALSSLSPALLQHSHRYKPAIIGEPLRFQGATFHFTYTLHAIPCVGFRVDWRGRSMVFTGDHFNNPPALQKLVDKGVMSKARCADLNHLPLQQTDLLLHEAGAPPIHTPLDVLLKLPTEVKKRMYVVHTSALPEGCELRVAPTGTAGTIRLDQIRRSSGVNLGVSKKRPSIFESSQDPNTLFNLQDALMEDVDEYTESELFNPMPNVYAHLLGEDSSPSIKKSMSEPPPVSLRPTSSSDAWFILNLLSAVPFLSSLSYTSTMEVLETARVVAYCCNEVVLSANRRRNSLVVVWEGTCMERESDGARSSITSHASYDYDGKGKAVWYAGDWTGPRILQPEKRLSGDISSSKTHDIVAMSTEGVKVIVVDFNSLHAILINGSNLYKRYHLSLSQQHSCKIPSGINSTVAAVFKNAVKNLNVIELLEGNTGLRKLTAVQKRHLECLVEGPTVYTPGQRLWRAGSIVDKAFIIVAGTVSFVPKRRHGGSAGKSITKSSQRVKQTHETNSVAFADNLGEAMRNDAVKAIRQLQAGDDESGELDDNDDVNESNRPQSLTNSLTETEDYHRLSMGLQMWAERHESHGSEGKAKSHRRNSSSSNISPDVSLHDFCEETLQDEKNKKEKDNIVPKEGFSNSMTDFESGRRPSSKDRFANKVLGRLYNRRAFASGLVFSRGHFLGDIEKMVEGLLSSTEGEDFGRRAYDELEQFDLNENSDTLSLDTMTLYELDGSQHTAHTSTLAAGKDGCVVLILPKTSLIPFLDAHPGLLLSLLGTQVVV